MSAEEGCFHAYTSLFAQLTGNSQHFDFGFNVQAVAGFDFNCSYSFCQEGIQTGKRLSE